MRSDREMLELAAKAASLEVWPGTGFQAHLLFRRPDTADPSGKVAGVEWNPRYNDGDNRRLQVRLRLGLVPLDGGGWDCVTWDHDEEVTLATDLDPNRAVVMAAAEIGAKTQEE